MIDPDDAVIVFAATQEARHDAVIRLNMLARVLVDNERANAAAEPTEEDDEEDAGPRTLRLTLGINRLNKSARQRRFLHGPVLGQISEQAKSDGQRYVLKVWKEYFRRKYLGDRWESYRLPGAKRATPHRTRVSTEDLTVKQYSDYIDRVIAHAATDLGVAFDLDPIEREGVRYVKKLRRKTEGVPA